MAIKLSANYSKKLGLPQYSSHSFAASVEIELTDISQVETEIQKLYQLLQQSVDQEIQNVGFILQASNGNGNNHTSTANGRTYQPNANNRHQATRSNGHQQPPANGDSWNCTEGQRGFILRIISDNKMEKQDAENLSLQLFGVGVKQLNKLQASQLIEDLLVKAGKPATRQSRWQQQPTNRNAA